jgi:hypothetical protein
MRISTAQRAKTSISIEIADSKMSLSICVNVHSIAASTNLGKASGSTDKLNDQNKSPLGFAFRC